MLRGDLEGEDDVGVDDLGLLWVRFVDLIRCSGLLLRILWWEKREKQVLADSECRVIGRAEFVSTFDWLRENEGCVSLTI